MKLRKWLAVISTSLVLLFAISFYLAGSILIQPERHIFRLPDDLRAESVSFQSESGAWIKGSWLQGKSQMPGILLLHGVRADRRALLDRARYFNNLGYSILIFDFQAHGESSGQYITFGFLESGDAHAAVRFMRTRIPHMKVGAIGISMGGAASVLGNEPIAVDALILESVYPDIRTATVNRMQMRIGPMAHLLAPLFLVQLQFRLGIQLKDLSPVERIGSVRCPLLILSGSSDLHTTIQETEQLFLAASEPKKLEIFAGAKHVDLMNYDSKKYTELVSKFFAATLLN